MEAEQYKKKMAVICGASKALELRAKQPRATEEQIIQLVTDNLDEILKKIDEE